MSKYQGDFTVNSKPSYKCVCPHAYMHSTCVHMPTASQDVEEPVLCGGIGFSVFTAKLHWRLSWRERKMHSIVHSVGSLFLVACCHRMCQPYFVEAVQTCQTAFRHGLSLFDCTHGYHSVHAQLSFCSCLEPHCQHPVTFTESQAQSGHPDTSSQ